MNSIQAIDGLLQHLGARRAEYETAIADMMRIRALLVGDGETLHGPVAAGREPRVALKARRRRKKAKGKRQVRKPRAAGVKRSPAAAPARRPGKTETRLLEELARSISASGLSPSREALAARLGLDAVQVRNAMTRLITKGFVSVDGRGAAAVFSVERWPEGVKPRATKGRADAVLAPASKPAAAKPEPAEPARALPPRRGDIRIKPPAKPAPAEPARAARPFGEV